MSELSVLLPELLIAGFVLVALIAGTFAGQAKHAGVFMWGAVAVFVLAALMIGLTQGRASVSGVFVDDAFSRFAKLGVLLSTVAIALISSEQMGKARALRVEYPVLMALSVLGMMITVSSADLITLYVGLELMALPLYVLTAARQDDARAKMAGLKVFSFGAISSVIFLFGIALTYGFAGTTRFDGVLTVVYGDIPLAVLIGFGALLSGLLMKLASMPFFTSGPDVYDGAPLSVTAFLITAPQFAVLAATVRLLFDGFGGIIELWHIPLMVVSGASMIWGALGALRCDSLKRLMGQMAILHMGFALMGLASGTQTGVQATLIYGAIYVLMSVGVFAFLLTLEKGGQLMNDVKVLSGYHSISLSRALAMLVLLGALAGLPPMLGALAKFAVINAAWNAGQGALVLCAAFAAILAAVTYLRLITLMFMGKVETRLDNGHTPIANVVLIAAALSMFAAVVGLFGLEAWALQAAEALVK